MMKLKQPSVPNQEVQAHGQERGDIDQTQDVNEKSRDERGQKEKDEKKYKGPSHPFGRKKSFEQYRILSTRQILANP
jgi:hypothetical protein